MSKMTKDEALAKALEWHDLIDQADAEDGADCFQAAERLRFEAADLETEIRKAGFDAYRLYEDHYRSRR